MKGSRSKQKRGAAKRSPATLAPSRARRAGERWFTDEHDERIVRDENRLTVATCADAEDARLCAKAPEQRDVLSEVLEILKTTGKLYDDDEVVGRIRRALSFDKAA